MRLSLLAAFLLLLAGSSIYAQDESRIFGQVNDGSGKPIASVNVSLFKVQDSSLVKVAATDKTGRYEFVGINHGSYFLSLSSVGFEKKLSELIVVNANGQIQVPSLVMSEAAKSLQGVTVQSTKPFVETKIDKTVVNVDASPTSAGATALEILEKSPGVIVSSEGAISLRGKQGVIVMLDGKPTYLSATDLANLLRNMPASQLDQIEIMTNPSAKYDASGNSGIINIKTKKGRAAGFNGSIMLGIGTSIYPRDGETYFRPKSQNSFNFNYKKGNLNLFGNYNPNLFRGMNTMNISSRMIHQGQTVGYTDQQTKFMFGNNNHTLKIGADWTANKKNTFGAVVSGFVFNGHPTPTTINNIRDINGNLEKQLISYTDNDIGFKNFTTNLNWRHNFDTLGQELSMDFDAVYYRNLSDMILTTDIYDGNLVYEKTSLLKGHLPANIDIYSFKTDYVKPLKNGKVEAGFKTSFVRNDNEVDYQNYDGSKWWRDDIRSNHFIYEENINAAYVSVNRKMNKWSAQAGLRVENTISKGDQVTKDIIFKRNRTDLFPTAFVSYEVNKQNQLTLSFGRRIQRPNYNDLNPFLFFLDTLSYRQGNIHLTPQYAHNIELSHAFKNKFITTVSYNITDDIISQIIKPKEESQGRIRYLTPDNVSQLKNMSLSITAPVKFTQWWNTNLFTTVFNNHYTGFINTTPIDLQYTSFTANITNTFTLGKGLTAELGGFYRHRSIEGLTRMEPIYQMTLGAQKQVMKGKGTIRLNVRDPFAWMQFEGWNNYASVDNRFHARPDIRQVNANFTYRFGQNGQNNQPRRRTTSSQDEQNRIGQGGQQ